jgi:TonB family protein
MTNDDPEAQRILQQRALRNVRALVDKLSRPEMGVLSALLWMALIGAGIFAAVLVAYWVNTSFFRKDAVAGRTVTTQVSSPDPASPNAPRRKFVSSGKDTPYAGYVSEYSRRVERVANSNYPSAIRGVHGTVQITAAIRSDGTLERVEINRTSGNQALDAAAERFVMSAQPFAPFSKYSLADADVLHITRTFSFEGGMAKEEQP